MNADYFEALDENRFNNSSLFGLQSVDKLAQVLEVPASLLWHIKHNIGKYYVVGPNEKGRIIEKPNSTLKKIQCRIQKILNQESYQFMYQHRRRKRKIEEENRKYQTRKMKQNNKEAN